MRVYGAYAEILSLSIVVDDGDADEVGGAAVAPRRPQQLCGSGRPWHRRAREIHVQGVPRPGLCLRAFMADGRPFVGLSWCL
jgi:hypothetical protein